MVVDNYVSTVKIIMNKEKLIYLKEKIIEVLNDMLIHPVDGEQLYSNKEDLILIINSDFDYILLIHGTNGGINISLSENNRKVISEAFKKINV